MNDYERVASIIRYLSAHQQEQPGLEDLARRFRLSPSHLHRLFTHWAGVTPKDFLQCLTVEHVRKSLQRGQSVLSAAFDAGLSGPGRLHDLLVTLEAASPGELKSGGAGWTIRAGFADSPFGLCLLAEAPRGICHLAFVDPGDRRSAWQELVDSWPAAHIVRDDKAAAEHIRRIFTRPANGAPPVLRAFVRGTPFQVQVWRALLRIPPGQLVSYGQIASSIGHPTACRAVGAAVGANPIAYLIPCHRVIRESGAVGDYRWGSLRKQAIVAWETSRRNASHGEPVEPMKASRLD
ncbi:MAG TPA: methylated-DNA--[protein]-cysteine S-methyltransferase [Verrucomicrobia bacterium]|nr:methylated-DNA--[protein]-cysteine S-methyltransferase [Verrucomicrobiota bacterium]HOP97233.1 methylated-DNA--[protein]-cysteine S-methyltransferase [Verrucomicrobiota bacterium]HPU55808.1 methylated-DNA--[protein]-cysteine S-methyltransferase [Verrucomicrobiota bacterium]